ncbi:MAG: transcriptional repressor, partial [Gammaproteobacteria bacterium]|nr:transcriptional repressor [Gammaproteobacteria bacterium]
TVYRALNFLLDNGLIHKLNSINAYIGCSHPLRHSQCYFLICDECGEADECCNSHLSDAIKQTTEHHQFQTRQTTVEISGKCRQCAQNQTDE